jgi:PhnB protein
MPAAKPVPDGYPSLTPYLIVRDGAAAIEFYRKVFGAGLRMKLDAPGGRIGHAELEIGDSLVMLADEHPEMGALAPPTVGGTPVSLHLYVPDVDAAAQKAVANGAMLKSPVENKFYGDRLGTIIDPFGHIWHISTHVEDVSPEEIGRRAAALARGEKS